MNHMMSKKNLGDEITIIQEQCNAMALFVPVCVYYSKFSYLYLQGGGSYQLASRANSTKKGPSRPKGMNQEASCWEMTVLTTATHLFVIIYSYLVTAQIIWIANGLVIDI